jgi:hypothetical protein
MTVYLKQAQINFLNELIKGITDPNIIKPSKSDVIRVILDEYCSTEDWHTNGLLNLIKSKTNRRHCDKIHNDDKLGSDSI